MRSIFHNPYLHGACTYHRRAFNIDLHISIYTALAPCRSERSTSLGLARYTRRLHLPPPSVQYRWADSFIHGAWSLPLASERAQRALVGSRAVWLGLARSVHTTIPHTLRYGGVAGARLSYSVNLFTANLQILLMIFVYCSVMLKHINTNSIKYRRFTILMVQ